MKCQDTYDVERNPKLHFYISASRLVDMCRQCGYKQSEHKAAQYRLLVSGNLPTLPSDAKERKSIPIGTGVLDYFPSALAEVAKVSFACNQQHNPGQPLHWARAKSTDQADAIVRHFLERGKVDADGMRHSAKLAWRALALLQLELEAEGAPIARGAVLPSVEGK